METNDMKVSEKNQKAHAEKIIAAVRVLMEYGLPDPVSEFIRNLDEEYGRPATEIKPNHVVIPISQQGYNNLSIDLTATAPEKILVAMFKKAWESGFEAGVGHAETVQAEALMEAFPKLKGTIKELADEVVTKALDEFRERFRD
jgi:hypothetical protein